jgi:integrase
MRTLEVKPSAFEKVGECLYRYTSSGTYYARFECKGKEIRRSLGTSDRALARRKLGDLQRDMARIDLGAGKASLAEMCNRYLATVQNQRPKTVRRKRDIAARIKADWPGGAGVSISKIVPSHVAAWLASYTFGAASYNLYLEFIRAVFTLAVEDRLLASSPVAGLKAKRAAKPIRQTPSFEDFQAVVADIRAQVFNADAKDSADFVEFIGLAGLGQAEAGALTWADIDWQKEQITTFRHKTKRGFMVPLYPQLRPLLERLKADRGGSPDGTDRVFRIKDAKHAISGACKRLKLPAYSHRSFRRTFITRAIERGVDVKVIAEWQGHRDGGKLILDTYSHVAPKHSNRMAKLMCEEPER